MGQKRQMGARSTVPRSVFDEEIISGATDRQPVSGLGEVAYSVPGIVFLFDQGLVLSLEIIKEQVPVDTAVIVDLLGTAPRPGRGSPVIAARRFV